MQNSVTDLYGNQVRVRASGICLMDDKILLVNHKSLSENDFWAPPGGGISFGERAETCVVREFHEETSLTIKVDRYLFACEFIHAPLHAIELFFKVSVLAGSLTRGIDPEMDDKSQIIQGITFLSEADIKSMKTNTLHGLFKMASKPVEILDLRGYFKL
jgi:8-oxo-dGTP diphosphatase